MKKLCFGLSLLCCAYLLPLSLAAQTECSANFSFLISGREVKFTSAHNLTAGLVHKWTFGDASGSQDANPGHLYAAPGTYRVTHYVYNPFTKCRDSVVKSISLDSPNCNIQPKFEWKKDTLNCRKVQFINQSTPISPNVRFVWKFGDGTSSNDINPSHIFTQDGVYNVCLVIESGTACRKELCKQIEIRCAAPCNLQIDFNWKRDSLHANGIQFKSLVPPVSTVAVFYKWSFGDNTYSNEANPRHVYQKSGNYKVCLVVETANCRREICKEVSVQIPPPPPVCNVQAKFESFIDSSIWLKAWFRNLSHPIQNIWKTSWSYGDGTGSQDFNSFHVYEKPGKYYVCLKVQSLNGCVSVYCDSVVIQRRDSCEPRSEFNFEALLNNPLELRFKPATMNTTWQYLWNFGDGTTSTAMAPTHKFVQAGTYKICLKVTTANNCSTIACKELKVGLNGRVITTNIPAYPNPARSVVKLELSVESATTLQMRVMDATGAPKMEFRAPARPGLNHIAIPIEKLSNGMYVVEIRYENQVKLVKFQKS